MPTTRRPGPAARRRRARRRVVVALVVLVVLSVGVVVGRSVLESTRTALARPGCSVVVEGTTVRLDPEQAANAATIGAVSVRRRLPLRAAVIATATAMQESKLRDLDHGDRDSIGLFQQRPSQGWGTPEQVGDPRYATEAFYDRLVTVPGYLTQPLTRAAQAVQRSGYPDAYAQHEAEATVIARGFTGFAAGAVTCRLGDPAATSSARTVAADVADVLGVTAEPAADGRVVVRTDTARGAQAAAAYAVGQSHATGARSVAVAGRSWTRGLRDDAAAWRVDTTSGSGATRAVISLRAPSTTG